MKNNITIIVITVLVTVAILGGVVYFMMPSIATQYMIQSHHGGDASAMMDSEMMTGGFHEMMMGEAQAPADADLSQTRASQNGVYTATWSTENGTPVIGEIHSWTLHIENADGSAVEGASIAIDGGMPQHGHGLPTQPQMTKELGNGDYLIEGMKFQMPGYWQVLFTITADQSDTVMFEMMLR